MENDKKYDRNKLKKILCRLKEEKYGIVLRGKGILANNKGDWLDFDFLPREIEIRKNKPQTIGQIVLIGKELNKKEIEKIRSEEHTSELQSRFDLVCRLLL